MENLREKARSIEQRVAELQKRELHCINGINDDNGNAMEILEEMLLNLQNIKADALDYLDTVRNMKKQLKIAHSTADEVGDLLKSHKIMANSKTYNKMLEPKSLFQDQNKENNTPKVNKY